MDDNGKLEHRTEQAFARMDKRVKNLELVTVSRQQLEDLLKVVPDVVSLKARVNRLENQMTMAQESRTSLLENDNLVASEMMFIRERLLSIEGRIARDGPTRSAVLQAAEAKEEAEA